MNGKISRHGDLYPRRVALEEKHLALNGGAATSAPGSKPNWLRSTLHTTRSVLLSLNSPFCPLNSQPNYDPDETSTTAALI